MNRFIVQCNTGNTPFTVIDQLNGRVQANFADPGDAESWADSLNMRYAGLVPHLPLQILFRVYAGILDSGDLGQDMDSSNDPVLKAAREYASKLDTPKGDL